MRTRGESRENLAGFYREIVRCTATGMESSAMKRGSNGSSDVGLRRITQNRLIVTHREDEPRRGRVATGYSGTRKLWTHRRCDAF